MDVLKTARDEMPKITEELIVKTAFKSRIPLSTKFDFKTGEAREGLPRRKTEAGGDFQHHQAAGQTGLGDRWDKSTTIKLCESSTEP